MSENFVSKSKDMKKILMISYYFPPLDDVGSLRALGFSKNLPDFGWEPYVLSVKNPDKSYCLIGDKKPPADLKVFYARSLFNLTWFTYKVNGLIKVFFKVMGKHLKRNIVYDLICIPDVFIGWIIPAFLKGLNLIDKYGIDIIYVSCKPFSSAIAGVLLKKARGKPLIIDFRDPVSFEYSMSNNDLLLKFKYRVIQKIEEYTLKNADMFIVTTDETKDEYLSVYPFLGKKINRIYNGFFIENMINRNNDSFDKFTIIYVGNFYYDAIPSDFFFQALKRILEKEIIPRDKFQFLYFGEINKKNNWLEKVSQKYGLQDIIVAPGRVSREETFESIARASILLLRIVPKMISTKLYEGLEAGIPLLATINKGEVEQLIKKYSRNSYIITSNNVDDVVDAILDAYGKWEKGELKKSINVEFIQNFNKKALTKEFVKILEEAYQLNNSSKTVNNFRSGVN